MKQLKQQVEDCLNLYPEVRNCDIKLTNCIWVKYYPNHVFTLSDGQLGVKLKALYELPREDNVKRIRAKLNSEGKYLPTDPEVIKQRRLNEEKWRDNLGYNPEMRTVDKSI